MRHTAPRHTWIPGTLAAVGALALLATIPADAQEKSDPAALFRTRCAGCHTVPDPELATDRAWLDQVNRTT